MFTEIAQFSSLSDHYFDLKPKPRKKKTSNKAKESKEGEKKESKSIKIPGSGKFMLVYDQVSTSLAFFLVQVSLTCLVFDYLSGGMLSDAPTLNSILRLVIAAITVAQSVSQFAF